MGKLTIQTKPSFLGLSHSDHYQIRLNLRIKLEQEKLLWLFVFHGEFENLCGPITFKSEGLRAQTEDYGETINRDKTLLSRNFPLRSLSNTASLTDKTRTRKSPLASRLPWHSLWPGNLQGLRALLVYSEDLGRRFDIP